MHLNVFVYKENARLKSTDVQVDFALRRNTSVMEKKTAKILQMKMKFLVVSWKVL